MVHLVAASTHDFAPRRIEPARTHCTYDTRAAYSEALSTWTDVGPDTAPSAGVMDLRSLAILELSTHTPNGARENLYVAPSPAPLEPMGFTGRESDEELGMTYFGERWLIPKLGRWASPDPLHVHASGGGEALNSYHYVSGNLLQARDPLELDVEYVRSSSPADAEGVAEGQYIKGEDHTTLYAEAGGRVLQPPTACAQIGPECLRQFVAMADAANATVTVYRPPGEAQLGGKTPGASCGSSAICGDDGAATHLDKAVWVAAATTGDLLGEQGCTGGGRCSGAPGGTGDSDPVVHQVMYLVLFALDSIGEAVERGIRRGIASDLPPMGPGPDVARGAVGPDARMGVREGLPSRTYDRPSVERRSGRAVTDRNATAVWDEFLGPDQTAIDPRDGLPDPDRVWSQNGQRGVRYGEHEMSSRGANAHYHRETWGPDGVANDLQRVQTTPSRRAP